MITKQRHTELTGTYPFGHFRELMMNGVMDGSGSLMWGMGWGGLLAVVVAVLGIAALTKYLFFNSRH